TYVAETATIKADAVDTGDGGKVIVWADDVTNYYGHISATGGAVSGNGGFAEVSGKEYLNFDGTVDLSASNGNNGTLLLDPQNLTITATTANTTDDSASPRTFTSNDTGVSTLDAGTISTLLNAGTSVTLQTGSETGEDGDIIVDSAISGGTTTDVTLTLTAHDDIFINADITGSSYTLGLDLNAGGDVSIASVSIALNGGAFTSSGVNFNSTGGPITAGSFDLVHTGSVDLSSVTTTGILSVTAGGDITQQAATALNVTGASSFTTTANNGSIALNDTSNSFGGNLFFSTDGTGNASFYDISDTVITANSHVGGNLSLKSVGSITQAGLLTVNGITYIETIDGVDTINLFDTGNNFGGAVTLVSNGAGAVTLNGGSNDLILGASSFSSTVTISAGGDITQAGTISSSGAISLTTYANNGNITLDDSNNNFDTGTFTVDVHGTGALTIDWGTFGIAVTDDITFGGETFLGGFHLIADGAITQGASLLNLAGPASFTTDGANSDITLNSANIFGGVTSFNTLNTGNVIVINSNGANDFTLGASTVNGALDVSSSGNILQTGALNVTGAAIMNTTANNGAIVLENANNSFASGLDANPHGTGDVSLDFGTGNVDLAAGTYGGNFAIRTSGNITQSGDLDIAGTSSFISDTNGMIELNLANNIFTGAVYLEAVNGYVSIDDSGALSLSGGNVGGDLHANSGGDLTQTAALTVDGTSTFTTDAGQGGSVILDNASNSFTGAVYFTPDGTGSVTIKTGTTDLYLGASLIDGNLTVSSVGTIHQTGTLDITGSTSVTTTGSNTGIYLGNDFNSFTGTVTISGSSTGNVMLDFGAGDAVLTGGSFGDFHVEAGGNITQSAAINVAGDSYFTTDGGVDSDIILDNTSNYFGGAASFETAGEISIDGGSNDLFIGGITAGGALTVKTGGDIVQKTTDDIEANSTAYFETYANDGNLKLDSTFNSFDGDVAFLTNGTGNAIINGGVTDLHFSTGTSSGAVAVITEGALTGEFDAGTLAIHANSAEITGVISGETGQLAANAVVYKGTVGSGPYLMNGYAITLPEEDSAFDEEQQEAIDQAVSTLGQDYTIDDSSAIIDGSDTDMLDFGEITGEVTGEITGEGEASGEASTSEEEGGEETTGEGEEGGEATGEQKTSKEVSQTLDAATEIMEEGSLSDAIDFMNSEEANLSLDEQKQFIKKLSSEKIVGSLKGSDNETVVEVGAVLEQTAKGKKTEQSDLAKMLTNK
ncbi:MAG: hypothetical protein KAJ75_05475, partial [Alphaproteobacteria bacterium]|nr:hypothetical protein [Alphaproteobacteria bacterium]